MNRFRASSVHFLISIAIGAALLVCFWLIWYPAPLFKAIGGQDLFLMLLAIDVTIGPVLTLIIFNPAKKSLKFDLAVIALLQAAALTYGVWTLLIGRPVYVAALGPRFAVIQANEIDVAELKVANKKLPLWSPKWVGTRQASEAKERERVMFSALAGADYGHYPQHHVPIETMRDELLANAKPISALRAKNSSRDAEITAWLSGHQRDDSSVVFQGLKARSQDMAVILDAKTAAVIGIAPFKPWD